MSNKPMTVQEAHAIVVDAAKNTKNKKAREAMEVLLGVTKPCSRCNGKGCLSHSFDADELEVVRYLCANVGRMIDVDVIAVALGIDEQICRTICVRLLMNCFANSCECITTTALRKKYLIPGYKATQTFENITECTKDCNECGGRGWGTSPDGCTMAGLP